MQAGGSCQEGARWMEKTGGKETECSCSKGSTLCEVAAARGEPVLLCGVDVTTGRRGRWETSGQRTVTPAGRMMRREEGGGGRLIKKDIEKGLTT